MNEKVKWAAVIVSVAFVIVGYKAFFPNDQEQIARRLTSLMHLLSKSKKESVISVAKKVTDSLTYFQPPVEIRLTGGGQVERTLSAESLERIKQNISTIKFRYPWVNFKVEDLRTAVEPPQAQSSTQIRMEFEDSNQTAVYDLYDLQISWVYVESEWKIQKVHIESVGSE
ncbi:MAG: hypothetical protein KDD61_14890 [Bdellovibrionales bacterium]|nr:hypothetical protein [Bdellovibrionales bacterium]